MQLFYAKTLNPRKACAVARYLELPVEFVSVDLGAGQHRTADFRALNPNAKVPVLLDGDKVLWESNAIMCYLSDKAGADLWPHDERQIEVLRWLCWDATEFAPQAGTLYFERLIKPFFIGAEPDAAEIDKAERGFHRYARILEGHLKGRRWLVADRLSVADFAVAIVLPYAAEARLPLEAYPEVRRWHAQLEALDAWRQPFPADAVAPH
ncbi:glutathione S-transferase family protein [Aquabacterium sp. A7-Y]|uniref:glutathione S-transferase family protein n=1 Tax=Aquabacterium sp. A7-Y TaxID=1349605 RepID=UPI00223E408B|nr:glutathione S-transferase family protein [Aquabacterium sp. A7-Y]MCW7541064.1 glutathione S-transferase family protein [Aquabacterium sp. A7-Y]